MKLKYKLKSVFSKEKVKSFVDRSIEVILSPWRFFKFICFMTGLGTLLVITLISVTIANFFSTIPKIERLTFNDLKAKSQARLQRKLGRKKHYWTPIKKINRDLIYSIVYSEDATYFEHDGVNYQALMDSLAYNIKTRSYNSGASTITQQVVKNLFLTNEKTIIRKFKEIVVTRKLEKKFTKNQILEIYLNMAEFGPDIYGVHSASWNFFKRPPSKIFAPRASMLAIMLPSPRKYYYSIFQNKYLSKKHLKKMRMIVKTLRYKEFIGPKQYREYVKFDFVKKSLGVTSR